LSPFICEAVAIKEDRRKYSINANAASSSSSMDVVGNGDGAGEKGDPLKGGQPPSQIVVKSDPDSKKKLLQLSGHQGEVFMCSWNPVEKILASGSADGVCRLWGLTDMDQGKWNDNNMNTNLRSALLMHTMYPLERFKDVTSVTWSRDGKMLATGCYDGLARVWDRQGEQKVLLNEHTGPVFSLKWNKTGNYLLSGSYDRRAVVWDPKTGTVVRSYMVHSLPVLDVDWKDDDIFATCSSDMNIHVFKVSSEDTATPLKTFVGHKDEVNTICWSKSGKFLASCSDDCTAKLWTLENGLVHDLTGHSKQIYTIRWCSPSSGGSGADSPEYLCTASFDGSVKVWNSSTGAIVHDLNRHIQAIYSIAPSPNGKYLATGSLGGYVCVWSLEDGSLKLEFRGSGDTFDVNWSHDGTMLSTCFSSGVLNIVDTHF
jgi:transducin (beta)-like 1